MIEIDPLIIIYIVCDYFHALIEDVIYCHKRKNAVKSRQIAMYFIRKYPRLPLKTTAKYFMGKDGFKDHTTVMHACKTVRNDMDTCIAYKRDVEAIDKLIINYESERHILTETEKIILNIKKENNALKNENSSLKDAISKLEGTIYGLKLHKNKISSKVKTSPFYATMSISNL